MKTEEVQTEKLDKALQSFIWKISDEKQSINYVEFLSDKMLLIKAIKKGIPYSIFDKIFDISPYPMEYWSDALQLSLKSLQRYSVSHRSFNPIHTEKILELAEVTEFGKRVFESNEKFKLWLETPNFALGSFKPMDLLKYSYGKEMVINELGRIEYGILA